MNRDRRLLVNMMDRAAYMMAYVAAAAKTYERAKLDVNRWRDNAIGAITLWASATGNWDYFSDDIDTLDVSYQKAMDIVVTKPFAGEGEGQ